LKEVRLGLLTHTFLDYAEKHQISPEHSFSIVYDEGNALPSILNLVSNSEEKRQLWCHALRLLIQTLSGINAEAYSLMQPWITSLKKDCDYLDSKATNQLLNSLNIGMKIESLEMYDKRSKFYFGNFIRLVRNLRAHETIYNIFAKYGKSNIFSSNFDINSNPLMNVGQFLAFLAEEQKETLTKAEAFQIIQRFSLGSGKLGMGFCFFSIILLMLCRRFRFSKFPDFGGKFPVGSREAEAFARHEPSLEFLLDQLVA
jgi:hypothetical protein